jgi:16S rRNA (guanine966-N2)-methyltransferase
MRIVGGRLKGRALFGPKTDSIRPTSDRLRETLFNILVHSYDDPLPGGKIIDLFAGTGAFGLEAVSRGADFCLFVDDGAQARALIRENVEALGLGGVTRVWRADATRLGAAPAGAPFTLAFLDPPYGRSLAGPALAALAAGGWLAEGALCVIEEDAKAELEASEAFALLDQRTYGDTKIIFLRREGFGPGARPLNPSPQ